MDTGRASRPTPGGGRCSSRGPTDSEDGSYEFDGRHHQLDLTEPEHGNKSSLSL